jgi:predicted transcriptional regulator YheO
MSDNEIINLYRPMIPFLAQVLGPSCEVLLHDVSRPDNSVVAIENGSQSGRAVGYPMTDLAHRVIETGEYKTRDSLVNYTSTGKGKCFISSTFFIKNEGRLIGLLCINRDMSVFSELEYALDRIKKQYNLATDAPDIQETLDTPVSVMLQNIVSSAIKDAGI